jgi:hypothetical protein
MDGSTAETDEVLGDLIAQSEAHRDRQMALLHSLSMRGESTIEALHVLGQIEDTLAGMRSRRAFLRALQQQAR